MTQFEREFEEMRHRRGNLLMRAWYEDFLAVSEGDSVRAWERMKAHDAQILALDRRMMEGASKSMEELLRRSGSMLGTKRERK